NRISTCRACRMNKEELFRFIDRESLAVLSTVSAAGTPQGALVGVAVTPQLEIIFDTVKSSRKYGNLAANPAAAFVIGCTSEKTVQFEGDGVELSGDELARYKQIYFAKFLD